MITNRNPTATKRISEVLSSSSRRYSTSILPGHPTSITILPNLTCHHSLDARNPGPVASRPLPSLPVLSPARTPRVLGEARTLRTRINQATGQNRQFTGHQIESPLIVSWSQVLRVGGEQRASAMERSHPAVRVSARGWRLIKMP